LLVLLLHYCSCINVLFPWCHWVCFLAALFFLPTCGSWLLDSSLNEHNEYLVSLLLNNEYYWSLKPHDLNFRVRRVSVCWHQNLPRLFMSYNNANLGLPWLCLYFHRTIFQKSMRLIVEMWSSPEGTRTPFHYLCSFSCKITFAPSLQQYELNDCNILCSCIVSNLVWNLICRLWKKPRTMNQLGVVVHCKGYLKRPIRFSQCSMDQSDLYLTDNPVQNFPVVTSAHFSQIIWVVSLVFHLFCGCYNYVWCHDLLQFARVQ